MGIDTLSLYDLVSEHLRHSQLNVNLNTNKLYTKKHKFLIKLDNVKT